MTYGIKLTNSSGNVTFDPSLTYPMTFHGSYTVPSYSAPGSVSVNIPGLADDGHWFVLGGIGTLYYCYGTISANTFTSTTVSPGTGTTAASTVYVWRNNSTTAPSTGYGMWLKNDAGIVAAQTDAPAYCVVGGPYTIASGDLLSTYPIPSGASLAAKPTSNTGYIYRGYTAPTAGRIYSSTSSNIEYFWVIDMSLVTPLTSGYGIQIFGSSGTLNFTSEYKSLTAVFMRTLGTASTWSIPNSQSAYALIEDPGYRRLGISYSGGSSGLWTAIVPTWSTLNSGAAAYIPIATGAPITTAGPWGLATHVMMQIT